MSLLTRTGQTVSTQSADSLGGLLFRNVPPGKGYRVRLASNGQESGPLTVHSDRAAPWDPGIYDQSIPDNGYTYLTTRDGTKLAIDVHPPTSPAGEPGLPAGTPLPEGPDYLPPYPTLIEYSGYGYADPAGPVNGIAVLANLMGFAVVDVNMRGTGCSGGAFDFFEPLQNLDGYDVIETIAHQPWVLDHKVGMMGISYGAISQLFTAQLDPPDLEAISPLSTIDATASTLYPGGILNTGFAVAWADQRQEEAEPAGPDSGQPYAYQQIQNGDTTCAANQVLHGEAADLTPRSPPTRTTTRRWPTPLDPISFVHKITVPTFMACQWEDEQTGGHCPDLVQHFTGTKQKWFTFTNGAHVDSLDPATFDRWYDFLELFVAHRAPITNAAVIKAAAPVIYQQAMGLPDTDVDTLPADPIQALPTYSAALAAFEKLPEVRVLFDNGAGTSPTGTTTAGDPYAGFEKDFSDLPRPRHQGPHLVPGPVGDAQRQDRRRRRGSTGTPRTPSALPPTDFGDQHRAAAGCGATPRSGDGAGSRTRRGPPSPTCRHRWRRTPPSSGPGAVHLWVRSSTPDVDLLATISEVRPDGNETFVQNGYLRASERKLSTGTTTCSSSRAPCSTRSRASRLPTPPPCRAALRPGRDPALLRGPRVPRRLAHPGDHLGAQRHAAGVVLRRHGADGHGDGVGGVLRRRCRRAWCCPWSRE